MNIMDIKTKLSKYKDKTLGNGASLEKIKQSEDILGVSFSKSYIDFLTQYGWVEVKHIEIYGLGENIPEYLDVVKMTISERHEMEPAMQKHLIPLMNDGSGNHYCLDTSKMRNGECPIVFWDHEGRGDQITDIVAPYFARWFIDLLNKI